MPKPRRHAPRNSPNSRSLPSPRLSEPGWARVQRLALIRREVREYLPDGALDLLLGFADPVLEGGRGLGPRAEASTLYATAMVEVDLERAARLFREPADEATALRVCELLTQYPGLEHRLLAWLRPSLRELWGGAGDEYEIAAEISVAHEGTAIAIEVDVEARPTPSRSE